MEAWGPLAQGRDDLFTNPVLTGIAGERDRTVAQVVLRWLIQREIVVIPKTVHPERMRENLAVFDFTLTGKQMACIDTLDTGASAAIDHHDPAAVIVVGTTRFHT